MRQMHELLDAEDIVLAEIEKIIDGMYSKASLLHETLVNEDWLEERLSDMTGMDVHVISHAADELMVEFVLDTSGIPTPSTDMESLECFVDKWLPAHLKYRVVLENTKKVKVYIGSIKEVCVRMEKGINSDNKAVCVRTSIPLACPSLHHVIVAYGRGNQEWKNSEE